MCACTILGKHAYEIIQVRMNVCVYEWEASGYLNSVLLKKLVRTIIHMATRGCFTSLGSSKAQWSESRRGYQGRQQASKSGAMKTLPDFTAPGVDLL
jgi:hypothetical protein